METYIGESIVPADMSFSVAAMAMGKPGLPGKFKWKGKEITVAQVVEEWKESGNCSHGSGERYVRKHWFRLKTHEGLEMKIYFERQGRSSGGSRWRLYSIFESDKKTPIDDQSNALVKVDAPKKQQAKRSSVKVLNKDSLIATVDSFNNALFFGEAWQDEASSLVAWTSTRLGKDGAYAGSFAMTNSDWDREFRLFTGEQVTTRAARAHIIAEEATRMLALIKAATSLDSDARKASEEHLSAQIFRSEYSTAKSGIYCCGKCSLSLWRNIVAGSFVDYATTIAHGAASLLAERDGTGGWKRFPFYYTLLYLLEAPAALAKPEIDYCSERLQRAHKLLQGKADPISARRIRLIEKALALK